MSNKISFHNLSGINIQTLQNEFELDSYDIIDMYINFKNNFLKNIDFIDYSQESEEFKGFIHKLHGTSGNLKIEDVYKLSKKILAGDFDEKDVSSLKDELKKVFLLITEKIEPLKEDLTNSSDINLDKLISEIIQKLDNYNIIKNKEIDTLMGELKKHNVCNDEAIENLKNLFSSLEYEKIIEILKYVKV